MTPWFVWVTYPSSEHAEADARAAVDEGLAACANILSGVRSIFRYDGRIGETEEIGVLFKTSADSAQLLIERLAELHPYDVPVVSGWPAARTTPGVLSWLQESLRPA